MRGRGLLIAAAVLQLAGALMALMSTVSLLVMSAADRLGIIPTGMLHAIAATDGALACGYIVASIFLLYRRRWAWIASLAANGLVAALFLSMPLIGVLTHGSFGVRFGEFFILVFIAAPLFVTIGLLIGARHAVSTPGAKTAGATSVTPSRGD